MLCLALSSRRTCLAPHQTSVTVDYKNTVTIDEIIRPQNKRITLIVLRITVHHYVGPISRNIFMHNSRRNDNFRPQFGFINYAADELRC